MVPEAKAEWGYGKTGFCEAPSGFGPLVGVLQTPALPLGHGAAEISILFLNRVSN